MEYADAAEPHTPRLRKNFEIGAIPASQNRNIGLDQFAISDFGFEMQESSNFEIFYFFGVAFSVDSVFFAPAAPACFAMI